MKLCADARPLLRLVLSLFVRCSLLQMMTDSTTRRESARARHKSVIALGWSDRTSRIRHNITRQSLCDKCKRIWRVRCSHRSADCKGFHDGCKWSRSRGARTRRPCTPTRHRRGLARCVDGWTGCAEWTQRQCIGCYSCVNAYLVNAQHAAYMLSSHLCDVRRSALLYSEKFVTPVISNFVYSFIIFRNCMCKLYTPRTETKT